MRVATPALVAVVLLAAPAAAQTTEPDLQRRTLTVTGHGEVDVPPDQVLVSFAVETTGARAAAAVADNAKRAEAVLKVLQGLIGSGDRVVTTRYSVEPRYEPAPRGGTELPRIVGYVARNEVQVESRAIDRVGELIDAATTAGANRVANLHFALADRGAAVRAALGRAAADARAQAEAIATGLGIRLGPIVSATTPAGPVIPVRRHDFAMMAAEARAPTPVEPGAVSVSAALTVSYAIE